MSNSNLYSKWFPAVRQEWDLPQLYEDLGDIRHQSLTPQEKMWLRGLLHCGSRNALAKEIKQDRERFREQLHSQLYPALAELTGVPKITSSKIVKLLEEQGYRSSTAANRKSSPTITQFAREAKSSFPVKMLLSMATVILTIITGVIIETSTGLVTSLITGEEELTGEEAANQLKAPEKLQAVDPPSGVFSYGGSTTWAPIREQTEPVLARIHPGFQLRYLNPASGAPGSGSGIQMLLANQLAFAQSSRPVQPAEYQAARQRGFILQEIPIAIDGIAIAVHPALPIAGLTIEQLRGIYNGTLTNWQELGGPNLPVQAYSRDLSQGGTVKFFTDNVLAGAPLAQTVQILPTTTQAVQALAQTPGSIYFASAPEILAQCSVKPIAIGRTAAELVSPTQLPYRSPQDCLSRPNQINLTKFRDGDYPLTRRLFVIVKEDDQTDDQAAGEAYATLLLTQEGQSLLEQLGFVPIRHGP
ncbi:MAG: PstS family phosphate ABC transporter substrate-binding protein [Cyanobacteria bacterium P01_G01_bin.54]